MAQPAALSRIAGGLLLTIALGSTGSALAQAADATSAVDADTAAPAEPRRRGRDRQREATPSVPAAAAVLAAPSTDEAAVADPVEPETVEAKLICKSIKSTGTRVARRVCGTPEQWASVSDRTTADAQETMRQVRDRTSIVVSQPDNPLSPGPN